MEIDRSGLLESLRQLVATPSVNPSLGDGEGEGAAAALVGAWLADAGLEVETIEPEPGRTSVLATLRGRSAAGPTLMLNGHLDTVPAGDMSCPFEPRMEDGRLHGRGAYDMKGGVAACVAAARALAAAGRPFDGTLQVAAVADEEHASLGTRAVLERTVPDAVIVTEPTALVPCSAHRGFAWVEVRTRGRAAHGSRPDLGVDANLMMGRVLGVIETISRDLAAAAPHPVAGRGSLHVGRLAGGGVWSVYADRCRAGLERRTIPGETGAVILAELEDEFERLRRDDPRFDAEAELVLERAPFEGRPDSPLLRAMQATGLTRGGPGPHGVSFWTDAAFFAAAGADTVLLGADGEGAHADVEWVDLDSVERLAELLARTARGFLADATGGAEGSAEG